MEMDALMTWHSNAMFLMTLGLREKAAPSFIWMYRECQHRGPQHKKAVSTGKEVKPGSIFATAQHEIIGQTALAANHILASTHFWYITL